MTGFRCLAKFCVAIDAGWSLTKEAMDRIGGTRAPIASDEEAVLESTKQLSVNHPDKDSVPTIVESSQPISSSVSESEPACDTVATKPAGMSSADDDSAYMTHTASTSSTPSSVSPVSWGNDQVDQTAAEQRQERVQRKSWAAGQSDDRYFRVEQRHQHQQLYQSESFDDIAHHRATADATTDEVVVPGSTMQPLFSSARRRLGRRRNSGNSQDNAAAGAGLNGLRRAPSSLFYLEYEDEFDDDDDDPAKTERFDDLPSSRKISAAAYLPRPTTDDLLAQPDELEEAQEKSRATPVETTTSTRRRRRQQHLQHLAVSTIDEILRRQDSSLQQYYQDTLRQVLVCLALRPGFTGRG